MAKLQIISAVGPLGSGKTSLIVNTIVALVTTGALKGEECVFLVNDEGSAETVGGLAILQELKIRIISMVSGCFTCSDSAETKKQLDSLAAEGFAFAFFEGFGIVSGKETRSFLESCGYPFHIVAVLDHKHFEQNLNRYSNLVKSQVRAATLGVAITKAADEKGRPFKETIDVMLDKKGLKVFDFASEHSQRKPLFLISQGEGLPEGILEKLISGTASEMPIPQKGSAHAARHTHAGCCGKDHAHSHDHGINVASSSFKLKPGTSFADVRKALLNAPREIVRIKGAVGGKLIDAVFGEWTQGLENHAMFLTLVATREIDVASELPDFVRLVLLGEHAGGESEGNTYELIRDETVPKEETIAEIEKLMREMPAEPVMVPAGEKIRLVTHPEMLQILKEIARRPSVKDEWFPKALKRCMKYWLKSAKWLSENESAILGREIATNKRELGVSIAWWMLRFGKEFGSETASLAMESGAGMLWAEGSLHLESLNSDPERAYWQCEEFAEAAKFGISCGEDRQTIMNAIRHCAGLAVTPELKQQWAKKMKEFE